MNQLWVYMCPPSWTPPPFPSYPSGLSQCTGFQCPVSYIELGLVTYFRYVSHTCFNAILSNHPTLAFSHRVQESVLYICCLFCCLTYRVIVNHLSKFHIYALVYCASIHFKEHFRIDDLVSPSPLQPCTENTSLVVQRVKNLPAMPETRFEPWVGNPLQYSCLEDSKCTEGSGGL